MVLCGEQLPARERWRWRAAPLACDRCARELAGEVAWWRAAEREVCVGHELVAPDGTRQVLTATVLVRPLDPVTGLATRPAVWCDRCAAALVARDGVLCARAASLAALRARWGRAPLASSWEALARELVDLDGDTLTRADLDADARARQWRQVLARRWGVVVRRVTRPRAPALLRIALREVTR